MFSQPHRLRERRSLQRWYGRGEADRWWRWWWIIAEPEPPSDASLLPSRYAGGARTAVVRCKTQNTTTQQHNSSLVVVSSAFVVPWFAPSSCVRKPSRLLIQKDLRTKTVSRPFLDRYLSVLALLVRLPFRIWRCTHMHERMNAGSGAIKTAAAVGWVLSWSTRVIDGRKSNGITIAA